MSEAISALRAYLKNLRQPKACAWTRSQSFESLAPKTLEECYELMDAIEQGNADKIRDELSDLLYHLIFYSEIAEEKGLFTLDDLAHAVIDKHKARMPAELTCLDAEQVNRHWEAKKHEHFQNSAKESMGSLLQDIPTTLPANCRAIKLQNRAAMVGFDWPSIQYVFEKLEEEIAELKMEVDEKADNEAILDEYGDLLFVCMNIARHLGLDPETALRHANQKFTQRFQYIERAIQKSGRTLGESNLEEMNALWEESKVEG